MRRFYSPLLVGAFAAAVACTDQDPITPRLSSTAQASRTTEPPFGPWARIVKGSTGPGSLYALYIPQNWNGDAVYFAHGIRPPQAPITLDIDQDSLFEVRDGFGALGYAFAYSSFSENGLAAKDGAERTHQLRGLLALELGRFPTRNYLAGYSLGALIGVNLAEQFPSQYDGLLAMCGMIGGTQHELQYIGDVRALFDYFYPGILPGDVINPPLVPPSPDSITKLVLATIGLDPLNPQALGGMFTIASTKQTPLAWVPPFGNPLAIPTMAQSLITALTYQLIAAQDVIDRTHGHSPYSNLGVTYTVGSNPVFPGLEPYIAAADAGVTRYAITPDAQNYINNYYQPTGRLRFPVLTVHNLWDPLDPYTHETVFGEIVATAGTGNMVLQRSVAKYGHCDQFETSFVMSSFQDLVAWVTSGNKPAN